MHPWDEHNLTQTRRQFFGRGATGIGLAALASLLNDDQPASAREPQEADEGLAGFPNHPPKAKRVIYLLQSGAPTHVDLFDYKPNLIPLRGTPLPASVQMGQRLTTMTQGKEQPVLPAIAPFHRHGDCGTWISDFLPYTASIADEICLIKSMHTEAINHAPAVTLFLTGGQLPGRPSFGAWLSYGLGSLNQNLPSFCVMTSRDKEASCGQLFYDYYWGSGFLPSKLQGVKFRSNGDPVLYLSNPEGLSTKIRRGMLDDLAKLNELKYQQVGDPEIVTRIAQYEMAYRMQASVPELTDLSTEPKHILDMYGPDVTRPGSFAQNCLLARRLSEQGVRYVQLMHAGWDQHGNLPTQLKIQCEDTDQPSAALVRDLKQRGLLDDTLIIWGGEFGRTVFGQGDINNKQAHGRDHHGRCFSLWMAGGGIKPGFSYGETDDFAYNVAQDPVHVHDFQATLMHLLGIDHTKLTFKYQGRHFRLTDVHGTVVQPILS
ncbi:MAG: DUF1501 domain-containing protein [Planctomycetota bacterium]|nr:DUF1501 domain-containing protein [Planctomycetota bacterium]MDA1211191.1 DUF1501 domain-containing protein [Planctomycetota bacterium]